MFRLFTKNHLAVFFNQVNDSHNDTIHRFLVCLPALTCGTSLRNENHFSISGTDQIQTYQMFFSFLSLAVTGLDNQVA